MSIMLFVISLYLDMSWLVMLLVFENFLRPEEVENNSITAVPTKSDSDVILCLRLLSKTLTCTLYSSYPNR